MIRGAWLLAIVALAGAAEPERHAELEAIQARFDHAEHAKALGKAGLGCTACHQVGATADPRVGNEALDEAFLRPPENACHACHAPADGVAFRGAPRECQTCHAVAPVPASHGAGWLEAHGAEARLGTATCETCHRRDACIECHERKTAMDFTVHDRTWLSVHGIAARTNPTDCATCHLQTDCVACHTTGTR